MNSSVTIVTQSRDKLSKLSRYLATRLEGHQQLLQIQDALLKAGSAPREQLGMAKLARAQINEHLTLLKLIQTMRS